MKTKYLNGAIGLAVLLLSACATTVAPEKPAQPSSPSVLSRQHLIDTLLQQAERDLAVDRLMWPHGNNAYEKFLAVQQIQPGHPQAVTGMQQILIRYVELGREALGKNKLAKARAFLAQAKKLDSHNPLVAELQESLKQAEAQQSSAQGTEFQLDSVALSARDDRVKQLLAQIARRVSSSDESVLIIARNDAEGRWIYSELRKAASGYRIRGDIKIESSPRILLLPPID
ncbi:hypothetical protein [Candidatus Pelagadaptatus aseana]|uniref:hypothetical protein n=1 Tax=Candidatus Pelagadaptatus aseana TaxID=3120508 RepID=UPI003C6FECF5